MEAWHWLAIGLALLLAELITGSTYLLWPAIAAWLVGLVLLLLPIGLATQFALFAITALALVYFGRRWLKGRLLGRPGDPRLNAPGAALIGALGAAAGDFAHGEGRVRLGDTVWAARSRDAIADGDRVEVTGVDGAVLEVRRAALLAPPAASPLS